MTVDLCWLSPNRFGALVRARRRVAAVVGEAARSAARARERVGGRRGAPSRFEGFGLTPIEGLAVGASVAASDIPAHREQLGEAVNYFVLEDNLSLVAAIRTALARGPVGGPTLAEFAVPAAAARFAERVRWLVGS